MNTITVTPDLNSPAKREVLVIDEAQTDRVITDR
jgi:hypothetical protein